MTLTSLVVLDVLVPAARPGTAAAAPAGYTEILDDLRQGLPARIALTPRLSLGLTLPTGLARTWLAADPGATVSTGGTPGVGALGTGGALGMPGAVSTGGPVAVGGLGDTARPALRLHLLADGRRVSAIPLVAGTHRLLPADPARPAEIALVVLGWRLNAGTVVGPGRFGSWLWLAWRLVGGAANAAAPPPSRPQTPVPPGAGVGFAAVQDASTVQEWR